MASENKKRKCLNSNFALEYLKNKKQRMKRELYYTSSKRRELNDPKNWIQE